MTFEFLQDLKEKNYHEITSVVKPVVHVTGKK